MKTHKADILISGAGAAGLTLALLLGRAGVDLALIDPKAPAPLSTTKISGRTVALMEGSLNIAKAAGIADYIDTNGADLKIMRLVDKTSPKGAPIVSDFDSHEMDMERYGRNLPISTLRAALYEEALSCPHIAMFVPNTLASYAIENNKAVAILDDGQNIRTDLIIGADGRNSSVRQHAGIKANQKPYGQSAITFVINHSQHHQNIATEFHRPGGPLALVPLDGNQSSVVWVEFEERANALMALKKQDLEQKFQDEIGDVLGGVTFETNPECWPLCNIKAETLTAPHVAILAEAAHVMSPVTAQGLNLSMRDVAALAESILDTMRLGHSPADPSCLRAYEKRRRFDIATRIKGVDTMMHLVSTNYPSIQGLRRLGIKLTETIPPIRQFAMRHGLTSAIDEGRLARGEAL